jgi:hypothetical protein
MSKALNDFIATVNGIDGGADPEAARVKNASVDSNLLAQKIQDF